MWKRAFPKRSSDWCVLEKNVRERERNDYRETNEGAPSEGAALPCCNIARCCS